MPDSGPPGERGERMNGHGEGELPDDVDRAFARLTRLPPPRGFAADVMRAAAARPARVSLPWLGATAGCVLLLGVLGFWAGQALAGGGLLDLLAAALSDPALVETMPAAMLLALLDVVPWIELLAVGAALVAFAASLRRLWGSGRGATPAAPGGA